jgi:hypothetical protein
LRLSWIRFVTWSSWHKLKVVEEADAEFDWDLSVESEVEGEEFYVDVHILFCVVGLVGEDVDEEGQVLDALADWSCDTCNIDIP